MMALSLLALCAGHDTAAAEVRLSGTPDRIVVQAHDATMWDILDALRDAFDLKIEMTGGAERRFTGVYAGHPRRVLARLLDGQNYVIRTAADGMTIRVLGGRGAPNVAVLAGPAPGAWQGSRLVALRRDRARMVTVNDPD